MVILSLIWQENISCFRYQTLAVATDASNKEDIGNKKISGKKLTVCMNKLLLNNL